MQPTRPLLSRAVRRLPLTSKQAGPNYYKGYGGGAMGSHTRRGGYILDYSKIRTYVVPDLEGFHLTPFVSKRIEKPDTKVFAKGEEGMEDVGRGPMSGAAWVRSWREAVEGY